MALLDLEPQAFVRFLREKRIDRFHLVTEPDTGKVVPSHSELQPLADFVQNDGRDFRGHEGMFFQVSREYDTLQGAFVHRTVRGQAAGGVRFWSYDTVEDYLRDGMRLAVGMTHKNAMAGLWWGGGKGVMARDPGVPYGDPMVRRTLYREYGRLMTAIRGCYVTAEDVGTAVSDMAEVFSTTRFTTCIPPELGGSGNPSVPTALGVITGMEAALAFRGEESLEGKRVAVQGLGHVGGPLVAFLFERGVAGVVACDLDERSVDEAVERWRGREFEARVVGLGEEWIYTAKCDIFAPCATGAVLDEATIPLLEAGIVCGAANNQLEDPVRDDRLLHERGILYVPDFLNNRMGIVTCADESAGYVTGDPLIQRHLSRDWEHSIYRTALQVLETSRDTGRPAGEVATEIAERLSLEPHPLFGHRGRAIIDSLVRDRWFEG